MNMRAQNTATLNITTADIANGITSFKLYDDGGKEGKYSYNADGYLTVTAPEGYVLQMSGTMKSYNSSGKLSVFDGENSVVGNARQIDFCAGISFYIEPFCIVFPDLFGYLLTRNSSLCLPRFSRGPPYTVPLTDTFPHTLSSSTVREGIQCSTNRIHVPPRIVIPDHVPGSAYTVLLADTELIAFF